MRWAERHAGRIPGGGGDVHPHMEQRIVVKGELDLASAPDLLRRLDGAIDAAPGAVVDVDFHGVSFIDSTGLGVLVASRRRAAGHGGVVRVRNPRENVRTVFEVTGLDKVFFVEAAPA
jgi:anti-anti-sigma factor